MIKAIIFDFSGVISTESFLLWLDENVPNSERERRIFFELSKKVDSGKITADEYAKILAEKTDKNPENIWPEMFNKIIINKEIINLIQKLKKNYKIALLSNHVEEWITSTIEYHNLKNNFDEIVISSQFKLIKPDPEIFHLTIKKLNVKPNEAVFIDDRQTNVTGGSKVGINSILYTTNKQLISDLKLLSVKI